MPQLIEANVDALVGPTHHFGGLGVGNRASIEHRAQPSSPRQAALEGLHKAQLLAELGIAQYIWLPPPRPRLELLEALGFDGPPCDQIRAALETAPQAVSAAFSSAFMWAANSATVSPSVDCGDGKFHCTPANLISSWHRASEAAERRADLLRLLCGGQTCDDVAVGLPLPSTFPLRDEGAANHMRLCDDSGALGINVFVHGGGPGTGQLAFLPRHSLDASRAIARLHRLDPRNTFFVQQHPEAIAAGAFHNDVVATSFGDLLIHHERAFWQADAVLSQIESRYREYCGRALHRIAIAQSELSLSDAVRSYLFNSQIVAPTPERPGEATQLALICPQQCAEIESAKRCIERLIADPGNGLQRVHYVSLRESMANGGGPACLRLRLPLEPQQLAQCDPALRIHPALVEALVQVIARWYPERLEIKDFCDPELLEHVRAATHHLHRVAERSSSR